MPKSGVAALTAAIHKNFTQPPAFFWGDSRRGEAAGQGLAV